MRAVRQLQTEMEYQLLPVQQLQRERPPQPQPQVLLLPLQAQALLRPPQAEQTTGCWTVPFHSVHRPRPQHFSQVFCAVIVVLNVPPRARSQSGKTWSALR